MTGSPESGFRHGSANDRETMRTLLAARGEIPASTETGEAPRWQGATTENIGHI
jgi:hypothetical protein